MSMIGSGGPEAHAVRLEQEMIAAAHPRIDI
jgi:hypothetical protein